MLNHELRPFLSTWHPRLHAHEQAHPGAPESAWHGNTACRAALTTVRHNLHDYALGFARLAGCTPRRPCWTAPIGCPEQGARARGGRPS
ncbi:hypothetical protein [Streptomyces glomeratus]|uniref:Uncharacterized protein n=1 Tax=Streptomyces glomeratus TaxID=284452 RepID=A0ABP6L2P2_9ACTN|nr:hypothetical protein [Streptomyces glomeratus]MCF1509594.1 hypothetical protein [Streptomyces glomeratus]